MFFGKPQAASEVLIGVLSRGHVVERYYAARYGRRAMGATEELELTRLLKELAAAVRQGRRATGSVVASGA